MTEVVRDVHHENCDDGAEVEHDLHVGLMLRRLHLKKLEFFREMYFPILEIKD